MPDNRILLKDFIDPTVVVEVNWAPTTIGWKVLYFVLLAWLLRCLCKSARHFKRNHYRRVALSKLAQLSKDRPKGTIDVTKELYQMNRILKEVACHAYPNSNAASLSGEQWCEFLMNASMSTSRFVRPSMRHKVFDNKQLRQWQDDLYMPNRGSDWTEAKHDEIYRGVKTWIKRHVGELND